MLTSNVSYESATGVLQVYPVASYSGVPRVSGAGAPRQAQCCADGGGGASTVDFVAAWRPGLVGGAAHHGVFANETVWMPPRQAMSAVLGRAAALLVGARLEVQSVSMALPRWSDFVLFHRVDSGREWQVAGKLWSSNVRWLKVADVVLAPRTAKSLSAK
ncbi:unnamed protein product [Phytophthora lilii]|uniref:Unnamed protein product n=1 Tax=Phytophthora lilii TaxID=2077276 RepID=A0A9W6TVI4_9STRA|nr:unnamed protein product [Phytophthora lilii]